MQGYLRPSLVFMITRTSVTDMPFFVKDEIIKFAGVAWSRGKPI